MVSVPPLPVSDKPAVIQPAGAATPLRPSRSIPSRSYTCDLLPPGTVTLIDGTPADAVVEIVKGKQVCRYLVAVTSWTPAEGLVPRWQKPDGTLYTLSFDGFAGTCDCAACSWEATRRADRRHGQPSGSYGCCKLDTLAELVSRKLLPVPGLTDAHAMDRRDAGLPPVESQQPEWSRCGCGTCPHCGAGPLTAADRADLLDAENAQPGDGYRPGPTDDLPF
jgi:hypothetical protein